MGFSNAERQARWRARRAVEVATLRDAALAAALELRVRTTELRGEIERLKARIAELEAARAASSAGEGPDEPEPGNYRVSFLLRADAAWRFAAYSGPIDEIDDDCCELAEATAVAWTFLAQRLQEMRQSRSGPARVQLDPG